MSTEIDEYLTRKTTAPRFALIRLGTVFRQAERSVICPRTARLDGQLALVTGGNAGIGFQTCRGLLQRGAWVIIAARDPERTRTACERQFIKSIATLFRQGRSWIFIYTIRYESNNICDK